jgi:hypothetical protein
VELEIQADGEYLAKHMADQKTIDELDDYTVQEGQRIAQLRIGIANEQKALTTRQAADFKATWGATFNAVESGLSSAIKGMLSGTENFTAAMRNLADEVAQAFIDMGIKMLVQWAENLIEQEILGKENSETQVASSASAAGAAGVASWAGAPWPIDIGAPAFGAQMALAAESFSALQGFDIPANINPVTQLHGGEMVLPKPLADTVRSATTRGGGTTTHEFIPVGRDHGLLHLGNLRAALNKLAAQDGRRRR